MIRDINIGSREIEPNVPEEKGGIFSRIHQGVQSFGNKSGDVGAAILKGLTTSEQKFGQDIGQALYLETGGKKQIEEISKKFFNSGNQLLELARKTTDKDRKEKLIRAATESFQKAGMTTQDILGTIRSNKQIIGDALGVLVDMSIAGKLTGVKAGSFGLTKGAVKTAEELKAAKTAFKALPLKGRLASIAKETGKTIANVAPIGYGADVSRDLQDDKSIGEALKPGLGTGLAVGIPAAIGGARAIKETIASVTPYIASNLSGVPTGAYERLSSEGTRNLIGKQTATQTLNETRASAKLFKKTMQTEFSKSRLSLADDFIPITEKGKLGVNPKDSSEIMGLLNELKSKGKTQEAKKILDSLGWKEMQKVSMPDQQIERLKIIAERFGFADRLPKDMSKMRANDVVDLLGEINSIPAIKNIDDPLIRGYKLDLFRIKDSIKSDAINSFGGKGGVFDKAYTNYAAKSKVLTNINDIINPAYELTPGKINTARNKLMNIFSENKDAYLDAAKSFESASGYKVLDKVAASNLSNILPKTLRQGPTGVIGFASDALALLTFPLSSPRSGSWLISKLSGYNVTSLERLFNAVPGAKQAIYNAVVTKSQPLKEAVDNEVKKAEAKNIKIIR